MTLALLSLSIDCADAGKLAAFWAAALGRPVDPGATPETATIAASDPGATGPRLSFHQVPDVTRCQAVRQQHARAGARPS